MYGNKLFYIFAVDFQEEFNNMITLVEDEDDTRAILEEEYERQNVDLSSFENPFQSWANSIHEESKTFIEEGTDINLVLLSFLSADYYQKFKTSPTLVRSNDSDIWLW